MKPKKILIAEDDQMLRTLMQMFINDLGHELVGSCSTGAEAIELCQKSTPDIILLDIHLDDNISGIDTAIDITKHFDIPIVFITGDTNKETIEKAISTGPYAYILKPINKTDLGINIELAHYKHRLEKEIENKEHPYKKLIEDSDNGVIVLIDNKIEYINISGQRLLEANNINEVLHRSFFSFTDEAYKEILQDEIQNALNLNKRLTHIEILLKSLNNRFYHVGVTGSVINYKGQKAIQLVISDQTEKIQAQKLLTEQDNIINNFHHGVITMSLSGVVKTWNNGAERVFGLKKEEIQNKHFSVAFPDINNDYLQENLLEKPLDKEYHQFELKYKNAKTNKINYARISGSLLKNVGNEITGIVSYCEDITDKKLSAKKLKTSKDNFKAIFDGSTEAIFFVDNEFNIIDYNRLAKKYSDNIFETSIEKGQNILSSLTFLSKTEFEALLNNTLDGVTHYLERHFDFGSQGYYLKITIYPIVDDFDEIIDRFCISFLDITEQKKIAKDLEDSKNELKPLFDSSIQRFYLCDLDYKLVAFNRAAKEIIRKEFNHILKKGDNITNFIPDEVGLTTFKDRFNKAKQGEHLVFKEKIKDGNSHYWSETHLDPVINSKGEIYRILLWTLDITEREENLQALKESEERYSLIAQGGNDGIWDWDLEKDTVFLSPRWKAVLGYKENETITRSDVKNNLIHPDDIIKTKINLKNYITGKTDLYENIYRLKHKDGSYRTISERGLGVRNNNGIIIRMAGTIADITEQKQYETKLQQTNKLLLEERGMFIKGNVIILRIDIVNDIILYVSENIKEMLGFSSEEFTNGNVELISLIHPQDYERHIREREEAINKNLSHVDFSNYRLLSKSGKTLWVKDFTTIIKNEKNETIQFLGYLVDITKEKDAEKKLEENRKKYFALFQEANDAIIVIDSDNDKIVDSNEKALELFEYSKDEFIGLNLIDLSPEKQPDGSPSYQLRLQNIKKAKENHNHTFYWQHITKNKNILESEVSLAYVQLGNKTYRHAIIRDISKRIEAERKLIKSEADNRALIKAIPDIIFVIDKNGTYKDYKVDKLKNFNIAPNKIIGKNHADYFEGEKLKEILEKIKGSIETDEVQFVKYKLKSPIGIRDFEARISALNKEEALMLVRDISNTQS